MNQFFASSDHHSNWEALEKQFEYCKEKNLPFVINGDVIGDYNFYEIADHFGAKTRDKLRSLYNVMVYSHAKKLAQYIDKFHVMVYFQLGNHEPAHFGDLVRSYLDDKDLFVDLSKAEGILEINNIRVASVSNVQGLLGFFYDLYEPGEIEKIFSHQYAERKVLHGFSIETLDEEELRDDPDWIRIMKGKSKFFDVFFTHGQVGRGAWRDDKFANEMPTLHVAAMLSFLSKVTVDAHLHTSHEMINVLNKPSIRAIGNKGYLFTKEGEKITYEKIEFDAPYKSTKGMVPEDMDPQILKENGF